MEMRYVLRVGNSATMERVLRSVETLPGSWIGADRAVRTRVATAVGWTGPRRWPPLRRDNAPAQCVIQISFRRENLSEQAGGAPFAPATREHSPSRAL